MNKLKGGVMDIQEDKDFAALPEVAKLYQACKERDLTIAEREYLKGARDAWQAKAQAVPDLGELQERIAGHQYYHDEHSHMVVDMDDVVKEISGFDSWKAQAVLEWFDYTKQSPQMDGNYQIFIKGEQITAKWVSRFGFADPIEGDALRQELITHWAMQPQSPKAQEPAND